MLMDEAERVEPSTTELGGGEEGRGGERGGGEKRRRKERGMGGRT
jgi:hypothetical protein